MRISPFIFASFAVLATAVPASAQMYQPPTSPGVAVDPNRSYNQRSYDQPSRTYNWREERSQSDWRSNTWRDRTENEDWRQRNWRKDRENKEEIEKKTKDKNKDTSDDEN